MADVSLQSILDQTRRAIDTGDTERAIGMAQHILQYTPTLIEGHRLLGEAYLNADQSEQAQASFQNVIRADPENIPAYYGLGLAQQRLGQPEAAIRSFEMALEIQPNLAELRTQLLRLYAATPGSAGQFRLSRSGLGRLYARGQMYSQAIDEFRAVLETEPNRADVRVALAETLWRDGQEDEAGDWSRATLERQPELLKPALIAAYLQLAAGEPEGETLWNRVMLQEPSLQVATTLFEVLPPLTTPAPTLPAFDMATWRTAQTATPEAPPAVEEAGPDIPASVVVDPDVFGSLATTDDAGDHMPATASDMTDTQEPETGDPDVSDSDLLAQLLGFAETPDATTDTEANTPERDLSTADDTSALRAEAEPLPESFSFDEWSFDEHLTDTPATTEPHGAVRPFSIDTTDSATYDTTVEPFTSSDLATDEAQFATDQPGPITEPIEQTSGGQAFSLDDWQSIPGLERDTDDAAAEIIPDDAPAAPAPQPYSLDEFLTEPGTSVTGEATGPSTSDEPPGILAETDTMSLSELGLGTEDEPTLAGTPVADEGQAASTDDFTTFSLRDFEGDEEDELSDLDRLDAEPTPSASPASELPPWARDDDEQEADNEVPEWLREQFAQADSVPTNVEMPRASDDHAYSTPDLDIAPFSIQDIGIEDADLEVVEPGILPSSSTASPSDPQPFSFADLGLDEADFDDLRLSEPSEADSSTQDVVPFSLADLEPDQEASSPPSTGASNDYALQERDSMHSTPERVADLGLSDEELARFGQQADAAQEPTPFTMADLGLSDDELATYASGTEDLLPVGWQEDEDALPDQETLDDTSRLEGDEDVDESDEDGTGSIHEAETQPFEVAEIMAEGGSGQPAAVSSDAASEVVLPPMPPELSRFYERLEAEPENHTIRLALARLSEQKGDTDRALEQYRLLIKQGSLLVPVVEDLQEMITEDYARPMLRRLHRLLGDAYTRQNRLDEALDEYSWT